MIIYITNNFGNGNIHSKRLLIFIIKKPSKIKLMGRYYKSLNNIFRRLEVIGCRWLLGRFWSKGYELFVIIIGNF